MKAIREYYMELGQPFVDALEDMLVFDAVICNTDRHLGNFGVLVDNKTTKLQRLHRCLTMAIPCSVWVERIFGTTRKHLMNMPAHCFRLHTMISLQLQRVQ